MFISESLLPPFKIGVESVHLAFILAAYLLGDDEFVGGFVFDDTALEEEFVFVG